MSSFWTARTPKGQQTPKVRFRFEESEEATRKRGKESGGVRRTVKVEEVGVEGRGDGLVVRVVVCLEVRVLERLFDRHPLLRVNCISPQTKEHTHPTTSVPPISGQGRRRGGEEGEKRTRQRPLQEIARLRTRIRKQRPKSLLLPKRQRPDVIPRPPRVDRVELVQRGSSEDV